MDDGTIISMIKAKIRDMDCGYDGCYILGMLHIAVESGIISNGLWSDLMHELSVRQSELVEDFLEGLENG